MTQDNGTKKVVKELVNSFKHGGMFDQHRKDRLQEILSSDSFARIAEETNRIADDMLKSFSKHVTKDKARMAIREQLNVNLRQKIESCVFQVMGTDDNIRLILERIAVPISAYLGLNEEDEEAPKEDPSKGPEQEPLEEPKEEPLKKLEEEPLKEENHQVCDMEIASDSEKGGNSQTDAIPGPSAESDNVGDLRTTSNPAAKGISSSAKEGIADSRVESNIAKLQETVANCSQKKQIAPRRATRWDMPKDRCQQRNIFPEERRRKHTYRFSSYGQFMKDRSRRQKKPRRDPDFAYYD